LGGRYFELKILDEFDSPFEVLVVAQRLMLLFGLLYELIGGFTCRHVVGLDAIDLRDFIHQQYFIL